MKTPSLHLLYNNKKGISLIELIAVAAIMTVVLAAAGLALYSGSKNAAEGTADYAAHGDAQLLETWLQNNLPTAIEVESDSAPKGPGDFAGASKVLNLYFSGGGFAIDQNKTTAVMRISGIDEVDFKTVGAGACRELDYTIKAEQASEGGKRKFVLSGGIVLNNVKTSDPDRTLWNHTVTLSSAGTGACLNIAE